MTPPAAWLAVLAHGDSINAGLEAGMAAHVLLFAWQAVGARHGHYALVGSDEMVRVTCVAWRWLPVHPGHGWSAPYTRSTASCSAPRCAVHQRPGGVPVGAHLLVPECLVVQHDLGILVPDAVDRHPRDVIERRGPLLAA